MIKRLQQKRSEEGFTLIELLIVIIVLGILAAIVVFAVGSTRSDAVQASCKTDQKSIELSAEASFVKTGVYPASPVLSGDNGALLRAMPSTSDYDFTYTVTPTPDPDTDNVSPSPGYSLFVNDLKADPDVVVAGCTGL